MMQRRVSATLIGLAGAAVAISLRSDADPAFILLLAVFGAFGAFVSGLVFAPLFGQPGWRGLALATFAFVPSTLLGAAVAGLVFGVLLGIGANGVWVGPVTVAKAIATVPAVTTTWVLAMTAAHLTIRRIGRPVVRQGI